MEAGQHIHHSYEALTVTDIPNQSPITDIPNQSQSAITNQPQRCLRAPSPGTIPESVPARCSKQHPWMGGK